MNDPLHYLKIIEDILDHTDFADKLMITAKILLKICSIYIFFEIRPLCKRPCKK